MDTYLGAHFWQERHHGIWRDLFCFRNMVEKVDSVSSFKSRVSRFSYHKLSGKHIFLMLFSNRVLFDMTTTHKTVNTLSVVKINKWQNNNFNFKTLNWVSWLNDWKWARKKNYKYEIIHKLRELDLGLFKSLLLSFILCEPFYSL